ncbi:MAG: molybdopterin molybdotransferase MoeA [Acidobacteriota bacterium]
MIYSDAVEAVRSRVQALGEAERVPLLEAAGRVLAAPVSADRAYPPVARSIRDGYALRAAELPGAFRVVGEVRAGGSFAGEVGPGECVEIMTGAPMPAGADCVVMVEHATLAEGVMTTERRQMSGDHWTPAGCDARAGQVVVEAGVRLRSNHIAMLATVGQAEVLVYRRPRVAILATGDEVVGVEAAPAAEQVRNSNSYSVAAQVWQAGGIPTVLPVAKDNLADTRRRIAEGLEQDLLLLSGGVSAGKYDLVETVLAEYGAEFFFTRVRMQPGQPLVFGQARGRYFFGLPGNPASTMVTFAAVARVAVARLGGETEGEGVRWMGTLQGELRLKPGLTRFLPAEMRGTGVFPVRYSGSGDVPALARANVFVVTDPERDVYLPGEEIEVLPIL